MSGNKNCVANEKYIASIKNIIAAPDPSKLRRSENVSDILRQQITNAINRHQNSLVLIPCDALTEKEIETYEFIVMPPIKSMCVTLCAGYVADWLHAITAEDGEYYLFQDCETDELRRIHDSGGDVCYMYNSNYYQMMQRRYNNRVRPWIIPRLRLLLFARSRAAASPFYKDNFPLDLFKVILRYAFPAPLVAIK